MIVAKNLSLKYGNKVVFEDTNFEIPDSSITAIIGANGAGKTSLLKLLLQEIKPTTGSITLKENSPSFGRGGTKSDGVVKGTVISYVPQNFNYTKLEYISVYDFVSLGLKKNNREQVLQAVKTVHLEHKLNSRLSELSGGELQKTAIAFALVSKPELLILDEPFSALDIQSIREIVELIGSLKQLGIEILIVVHDINPILHIIDGCVYFLDSHGHYLSVETDQDKEHLAHIYSNLTSIVHNENDVKLEYNA
jgi:ABC-type Mn2+/Zn2+ transport system ATPase subunit